MKTTRFLILVLVTAASLTPASARAQESLDDLLGTVLRQVVALDPDRPLGIMVDDTVLKQAGTSLQKEGAESILRVAKAEGFRSGPRPELMPCPSSNPLDCSLAPGIARVAKFEVEDLTATSAEVLTTVWTRFDGEGWVTQWREYRVSVRLLRGEWQVTKLELVRFS